MSKAPDATTLDPTEPAAITMGPKLPVKRIKRNPNFSKKDN